MRDLLPELPTAVLGASRWWVALSGGADSVALLYSLAEQQKLTEVPTLCAIHVNHGLHRDAGDWERVCQLHCNALGIELSTFRCKVKNTGAGLEAAAREARYQAFESCLAKGDVLFTGHHRDDLVETVFLRLLRGAGPRGLAAIPAERPLGPSLLYRPFLHLDRSLICDRVAAAKLNYVKDPSNEEVYQDRNYLRHVVIPLIAERWPSYRETVSRASMLQRSAYSRLTQAPLVRTETPLGEPGIRIDLGVSVEQIATQLHQWLVEQHLDSPDHSRLMEFARQGREARMDRLPELVWGENILRIWQGQIIRSADTSIMQHFPAILRAGDFAEGLWGELHWVKDESGWAIQEGELLSVSFSGELDRASTLIRSRKTFSKFLREAGIPPWWRNRLPVFCIKNKPVWILPVGSLPGHTVEERKSNAVWMKPLWKAPSAV